TRAEVAYPLAERYMNLLPDCIFAECYGHAMTMLSISRVLPIQTASNKTARPFTTRSSSSVAGSATAAYSNRARGSSLTQRIMVSRTFLADRYPVRSTHFAAVNAL